MDPAFPDIVGEWAEEQAREDAGRSDCANDNDDEPNDWSDPLLPLIAKLEVEATRLW